MIKVNLKINLKKTINIKTKNRKIKRKKIKRK